jgi:hypothetical protein
LLHTKQCLEQKLKRIRNYNHNLKIELDLEEEKNISNSEYRSLHQIKKDASNMILCVKYLIHDLNFFYVLTRSFSSDAVEALFSNIRLR